MLAPPRYTDREFVVKTGADPAAGVECSDTVPAGKAWRLITAKFTLVTDATVANRETSMTIDDGATEFLRLPNGISHVASTTRLVYFHTGGAPRQAASVALVDGRGMPDLILLEGYRIKTVTTAIVAGDNYGAPIFLVEEFTL